MNEAVNGIKEGVEIDLQKLLLTYLRKWWLLALCGLIGAGIALYISLYHITPLYQASVTVYVNNTRAGEQVEYVTSSNLATSQRLVNTYVNIIRSDTVLTRVAEESGLNYTPAMIRSMMTTAQVDDTEIFDVYITHPDPQTAAEVANAIAQVAPAEIEEFVEGSSTKIIDYAKVPTSYYSPNHRKNVLLGTVVGIVLAVLYVALRYLLDVRIKDTEDLEILFDIPVLGQIPVFNSSEIKNSGYGYETTAGRKKR